MKELNENQLKLVEKATFNKTRQIGFANARLNKPYIKKTILDIKDIGNPDTPAFVISAGPSLHRKKSIPRIVQSGVKATIVSTDGGLGTCLRNGLIPDYVVSVDPHPTRIVRWFGDKNIKDKKADDYFRRQDLDPILNKNEEENNRIITELLNKHGKNIKMILSTSVSPTVTERCVESGADIYWWNPLYDDYNQPGSASREIFNENKVPCMVTGGNVGTSSWVFTKSILKRNSIAFVGMDLGYAPGTPLLNTQYYTEIVELFGEQKAKDLYIHIKNPYLNETWFTDPAYYWYRQGFLELLKNVNATVYNCTEGGLFFGEGVEFISLDSFLNKFR